MISLELPFPPSLWALYRGWGKSRNKTERYKIWLRSAGNEILATPQEKRQPIKGKFTLYVAAGRPDKRKHDLDNILKATCDLLAAHGLIENDCLAESMTVAWEPTARAGRIEITALPLRATTGVEVA